MSENTINEIKKTDIGTGVQMSKYLHHNRPASQSNNISQTSSEMSEKLVDIHVSYGQFHAGGLAMG